MAKKAIRPIKIEGNIAHVPLTQGYEAIIDTEDVALIDGKNWYAYKCRNTIYAASQIRRSDGFRTTTRIHSLITGFSITDHVDGNGLNNRRSNLREATHSQNAQNRGLNANNSSGYKGVSWHKRSGKWQARIKACGKLIHLGFHETPELASAAYIKASVSLHPQFGRIT